MQNLKDKLTLEELTTSQVNSKINKIVNDIDKLFDECEDNNFNSIWALGRILIGLSKKNYNVEDGIKYFQNKKG